MNNEELTELINKLKRVTLQLNDEIDQLQALQRIRQASRNTGRNTSAREYATYGSNSNNQGNKANTNTGEGKHSKNNERRLKVGDSVEVIRGNHQGTRATIVRETASQFELKSERVIGTFRKWKTNVRKIKNQNNEHEQH